MFDVPQLKWSESHGAENGHQGAGALYFSLTYMLKAKRAVCLGSGSGFVPLLMLSAQRRLIEEGILDSCDVTLVDADFGEEGLWGLPVYKTASDIHPDLRLNKNLTVVASQDLESIDYLHVDADHSYEGVMADLESYFPRLSNSWAITVHDTLNVGAVSENKPIGACTAAEEFSKAHGLSLVNFGIGGGTALILPAHKNMEAKPRPLLDSASIVLGTQPGRAHLGPGWGGNEVVDGTNMVWSVREKSWLEVNLDPSHCLYGMRLYARSIQALSVNIRVNGIEQGVLRLDGEWTNRELRIPPGVLIKGKNQFEFGFDRTFKPSVLDANSNDTRNLAMALSTFSLVPIV
jgi:hypothetical protein